MTPTVRVLSRFVACSLLVAACGGGDDDPAAGDGGPTTDAAPVGEDPCGFGSDRFLPFVAGHTWTYRVTDLSSGARETKDQDLVADNDETFGDVLVQTTGKLNGSTRSLFVVEGDRVVRLQQEDLDGQGALERTTTYEPGQIRIDESPARVESGATWEESYDETEVELGGGPVTVATVDAWEVVAGEVACESPMGAFTCLHLRRTRTAGGVAVKDFFFARGVGKIRESGDNQIEELTACGT